MAHQSNHLLSVDGHRLKKEGRSERITPVRGSMVFHSSNIQFCTKYAFQTKRSLPGISYFQAKLFFFFLLFLT
jgi:hypothetical protein